MDKIRFIFHPYREEEMPVEGEVLIPALGELPINPPLYLTPAKATRPESGPRSRLEARWGLQSGSLVVWPARLLHAHDHQHFCAA